MDVFTVVK